jgi:hypothetical protein
MSATDDFKKHSDDLIARLKSGKPIEMSEETRQLAERVVAYQATQQNLSEAEIAKWAKGLVDSMYGKGIDSKGE